MSQQPPPPLHLQLQAEREAKAWKLLAALKDLGFRFNGGGMDGQMEKQMESRLETRSLLEDFVGTYRFRVYLLVVRSASAPASTPV